MKTAGTSSSPSSSSSSPSSSSSSPPTGGPSSLFWLDGAGYEGSDFSIDNIPFGVGSYCHDDDDDGDGDDDELYGRKCRCLTAIGEYAVDLAILQSTGVFDDILEEPVFQSPYLNDFMDRPPEIWSLVRRRIRDVLTGTGCDVLTSDATLQLAVFRPLTRVRMELPAAIGDYTDFYSSREHATNVGTMFRDPDHALNPNWLHLPVGYHGRASTVQCSPRPVVRPCGQVQEDPDDPTRGPAFRECRQLDFELEVAFFVGNCGGDGSNSETSSSTSSSTFPLSIEEARRRIFGFVLMNDWSARDVQRWEYVPLGPFTSKNFATSVSPWIVAAEALEAYRATTSAVEQSDPAPLPYLRDPEYSSFDVQLRVAIRPRSSDVATEVCVSNLRHLYWTATQQLVHHSVTGCVMRTGDLLGSGTISGVGPSSYGSLLELSWGGTRPVRLGNGDGDDGETRTYLEDGDTVIMSGACPPLEGRGRVGFGQCIGQVLKAGTPLTPQRRRQFRLHDVHDDCDRYTNLTLHTRMEDSCESKAIRFALRAANVECKVIKNDDDDDNPNNDDDDDDDVLPVLEFSAKSSSDGHVVKVSGLLPILRFIDGVSKSKRLFPPRQHGLLEETTAMEIIEHVLRYLKDDDGGGDTAAATTTDEGTAAETSPRRRHRGFRTIQRLVSDRRRRSSHAAAVGPFALGGFAPSAVDCVLYPHLARAEEEDRETLRRDLPTLSEILASCRRHPWFQ